MSKPADEMHRKTPWATFLTVVLTACTLVTFTAPSWWLGELIANLRVQGLIAIVGCGAVFAFRHLWKHAGVLCACLAINAWWLAPGNTVIEFDAEADDYRICTANLLTANTNFDAIVSSLLKSNADVIGVPELSHGHEATLAGGEFAQAYPFSVTQPSNNGNFGIGLYSRQPLSAIQVHNFGVRDIPTISANVELNGQRCHVIATHVLAPMGPHWYEIRRSHLTELAAYIQRQRINHPSTPVAVFGDFNLTPWSPLLHDFLQDSGLKRSTSTLQPTWHGIPTIAGGLHIDLILVTDDFAAGTTSIGEPMGSDHLPVTVSLRMKKARESELSGS